MDSPIAAGFRKMNLTSAERHVFLCIGPDCCAEADGLAVWETLKAGIATHRVPVMRTKAACLRICNGGPWLVIYPDGIWYGGVTPEKCTRIIEEHLLGNQPVTEWIAVRHEFLPPCSRLSS